MLPQAKRQTATSMRGQTAMSTRTPGAVGTKPKEPALLLRVAGEDSKRAAAHQPLAGAVGNPEPRVLVVRQASVAGAAGVAGSQQDAAKRNQPSSAVLVQSIAAEVLEDVMTFKYRGIAFTTRLLLFSFIISLAACTRSEKPSARVFASPEDAGNALQAAAKSGDQNAALAIFGPDSREIIVSADPVKT